MLLRKTGRRAVLAGLGGTAVALAAGPLPGRASDPLDPSSYLAEFEAYRAAATDYLPEVEAALLRQTSGRRDAAGAPALAPEERLCWIARFYAARIHRAGSLSHIDPQGRGPGQRVGLLHRRLVGLAGENLFQSNVFHPDRQAAAGAFAVDSLMESPGHRRNILERRWTHAGMGVVLRGDSFVAVQLFVQRMALLADDLPARMAGGWPLPPAARRFAEGMPDRIGFGRPEDGPVATDTVPLAAAATPKRAGVYRCLYAFLRERTASGAHFEIAPGPIVRIT